MKSLHIIILFLLSLTSVSPEITYQLTRTKIINEKSIYDPTSGKSKVSVLFETKEVSENSLEFTMRLKDFHDYGLFANFTCYTEGKTYENESYVPYDKTGVIVIEGYCLYDKPAYSALYSYKDSLEIIKGEGINVEINSNFEVLLEAKSLKRRYALFRQVNSFNKISNKVSFSFHELTNSYYFGIEKIIPMEIALLSEAGNKIQDDTIKFNCSLEKNITENNRSLTQADYKCEFETNLTFSSLEVIDSEKVSSLPHSKILLNPALTDKAIQEGKLLNYSNPDVAAITPPFITEFDSYPSDECKAEVRLKPEEDIETDINTFTIPLISHDGVDLICSIPKMKANDVKTIECLIDGIMDDECIMFGQTKIMDGNKEILVIDFQWTDVRFTCSESLKEKYEKKLNITFSFRSALGGANNFKLYASETNEEKNKPDESHNVTIFANLVLDNDEVEKTPVEVPCICYHGMIVECRCNYYNSLKNFTSIELTESNVLSGIPKYRLLKDPDKAIKAFYKDFIYDVGSYINIFIAENIIGDTCSENGVFYISGKFKDKGDYNNKEFILFLTYPIAAKAKCIVEVNQIKCVSGSYFKEKEIMIEQLEAFSIYLREELFAITRVRSNTPLTCIIGSLDIPTEDEIYDYMIALIPPEEEDDDKEEENGIEEEKENGIEEEEENGIEEEEKEDLTEENLSTDKVEDKETSIISSEKSDNTGIQEDEVITKEEAIKKTQISLSFRQLTGFKYSSGTISFLLYALATEEIQKGNIIYLLINLIKASGETEENAKNISCILQNDVKPVNNNSVQAEYKCELSGLEIEYISLRLNNSENIVGIPVYDETSLNPVLTDKAIEKGEKLNYTDENNLDKIPASFIFKSIDQSNCKEKGFFTIKGELTKEISIPNKFTIPLTYPDGVSISCSLVGTNLECSLDREIKDVIILEQIIIKDENIELLNIKGFTSPDILDCDNEALKEAETKSELSITFRQVSHLVDNQKNGFSFFFAGLIKKSLKKGESFIMKLLLLLNGIKTEKQAKCILNDDVTVESGEQTQGNFNCEVTLENEEYKNLNLSDPNSIIVSPDNEAISGCSELNKEESSPKATDDAIENSKNENSELAKVIDFSLQENKNKIPPVFEINDIIELNKCKSKGKFKLKGKVSSDIDEEISFELPLSYPKSNIKCEMEKTKKDKENEINCKVQKGFKDVKSFVIEPRLIKKKRKELLFITGKKIEFNQAYDCDNYNNIKLQKAKAQKSSPYFFLQMSRPQTMDPSLIFFMALLKKESQTSFIDISINIDVIIQKSSRLRILQGTSNLQNLIVNCKVEESSSTSGSFGCTPEQNVEGSATKVEINDNNIGGVPDIITVETNPKLDLTLKQNLGALDKLPSISISDFDGEDCEINGKFTIKGDITGTLNNADNITIQLYYPESSGLCALNVENNKAVINCENAEDFSVSTIMIYPQIIFDKYGTTPLFKFTNDYSSTNQYSCVISYQWSLPYLEPISSSFPSSSSDLETQITYPGPHIPPRDTSNKLSKGAIAAIVICSVVVLGIVIALVILGKKGVFNKNKNNVKTDSYANSSIMKNFPA